MEKWNTMATMNYQESHSFGSVSCEQISCQQQSTIFETISDDFFPDVSNHCVAYNKLESAFVSISYTLTWQDCVRLMRPDD